MLDVIQAHLYLIVYGVKDVLHGIFIIILLDKKIENQNAEQQRRFEESIAVRERTSQGRRHATVTSSKKKVRKDRPRMIVQVVKTAALSALIWFGIWLFTDFVIPGLHLLSMTVFFWWFPEEAEGDRRRSLQIVWEWVELVMHNLFTAFFVLPLYLISKVVSTFWFADVAESVYRLYYGRPKAFPSVSSGIADMFYNVVVEGVFLLQAHAVFYVPMPVVGHILYYIHMSLLYSLYAFEYKWFMMGLDLPKRLQLIDNNWPYFCGFGLPLFLATHAIPVNYPFFVSACVFSILFPSMIVSGTRASAPTDNTSVPSLRIFQPTLCLSNLFFSSTLRLSR